MGDGAEHIIAFMRGGGAITVVPRLLARLGDDWGDTRLDLPPGDWKNVLTRENYRAGTAAADLFKGFPVALLVKDAL